MIRATALVTTFLLLPVVSGSSERPPRPPDTSRNPLDALTSREITSAVAALRAADHVDDDTLYSLITLREPPKTEVLEWKPGKTLPRRAFVIARRGALTFEAVVDVDRSEVESWKAVPGAQPSIVAREFEAAERIVKSHPGWRAAVAERGIVNVDAVVCIPLAAGYFGTTPKPDRRRVKVVCFDSEGVTSFWGRPISGLVAEVDLDAGKVIELVDSESVSEVADKFDFRIVEFVDFCGKEICMNYFLVAVCVPLLWLIFNHVKTECDDKIRIINRKRHAVLTA